MNQSSTRLVVYPKDVQAITGRCYRSSRHLLKAIRNANGKDKKAYVTVEEFCRYTGLKAEFVWPFLE